MPYVVAITDSGSYTVNRSVMRQKAVDRLIGASVTLSTEDRAATETVGAGFNAVVSAAVSDSVFAGVDGDTVEYQIDTFLNIGGDVEETDPATIIFYRAAASTL